MAKAKKETNTQPLEKTLWLAADKLRKNMDAAEYKHIELSFKLTLGRIAITTETMLSNKVIAHFKLKSGSSFTSEFVYLFLKTFNFGLMASTSSIADAVNSQMIKDIEFPIPNKVWIEKLQPAIIAYSKKIRNNKKEIQTLTQLRDSLLPRLMSGRLRVG